MSINGLIPRQQRAAGGGPQSPFELLRLQMDDLLGDGGILKEVVQPGEGPPVPENASVLIHYSGFLEYSDRPFETTTNLKHPRMMKLGRDLTLAGLELGVLTMRKGEQARFLLRPGYAYGDLGCPPFIPAAANVLYEVHILNFLDSQQAEEFLSMSPEEQSAAPLSTLLHVVSTLRSLGNHRFFRGQHDRAMDRYKEAAKLLEERAAPREAGEEEPLDEGGSEFEADLEFEDELRSAGGSECGGPSREATVVQSALLPLYLNLSLSALRLERPHKALKFAQKALELQPTSTKALFRCAQAHLGLGDCENALKNLNAAQAQKPYDPDINGLLKTVAMSLKDDLDKEKEFYTKMFRGLRGRGSQQEEGPEAR